MKIGPIVSRSFVGSTFVFVVTTLLPFKGNTVAMQNLGSIYEMGRNVPRDEQKARQWYQKAAAAGDRSAADWLLRHPAN
jgi:TPR repeat protein